MKFPCLICLVILMPANCKLWRLQKLVLLRFRVVLLLKFGVVLQNFVRKKNTVCTRKTELVTNIFAYKQNFALCILALRLPTVVPNMTTCVAGANHRLLQACAEHFPYSKF